MDRAGFLENFRELIREITLFYNRTLFHLGNTSISLGDIVYILVSIFLLFYISGKLTKLLVEKILSRYSLDVGVRQSIGTIIRYTIVIIGLVVIIQTAGVDLSTLGILAGALGVGIGFGLQNITSNFISGIIILFERPIKIGDRIEVGDVTGDVVNISARATTVITNDNIAIIVPNSDFISETVINWSHNGRSVRFNFPVPVSYNSNPTEVKKLLADVAKGHTGVLKVPAPDVLFDGFDDSSLNFNLRVWTSEYIDRPGVLKSQLYYEIFKKFAEHKIEIPYPQRDLHLKSGFDKIATAMKGPEEEQSKKESSDPGKNE
jgi:small-conductance mechanosensitive channel